LRHLIFYYHVNQYQKNIAISGNHFLLCGYISCGPHYLIFTFFFNTKIIITMLKNILFLLMLICCTANNSSAQAGDPCDSVAVSEIQAELIAQGFTCLTGAGPFACVNDVFEYAFTNCPNNGGGNPGDPCDSVVVEQTRLDMIEQGYTCLTNAGPFPCLNELYEYAEINCPLNGNSCDSFVVAIVQADLIAAGYDCLVNAGPFACTDDVVMYAMTNCPGDTTTFDCVIYADSFATFQQLILYFVANCPMVNNDIPACWLTAPIFATDDEFLQWVVENCDPTTLVSGNSGALAQSYFGTQGVSAVNTPTVNYDLNISPNPATDVINVRVQGTQINWMELVDINGRRVLSAQNIASNQTNINISSLPAGMYMLRAQTTDNKLVTNRIVKQ
jgi:hypothetical protein